MDKLNRHIVAKLKNIMGKEETGDEMRERINRQIREYNAIGIASIKFIKGEWYE